MEHTLTRNGAEQHHRIAGGCLLVVTVGVDHAHGGGTPVQYAPPPLPADNAAQRCAKGVTHSTVYARTIEGAANQKLERGGEGGAIRALPCMPGPQPSVHSCVNLGAN